MSSQQKTKKVVSSKILEKREKEKPVWSCDYCQMKFSCSSKLRRHVPVHTGQKDFHCNLCDFSSAQKGDVTVHIRRHLNERPFKCVEPNCGASFTTASPFKRHQLTHNNKRDKKIKCSACSYKTNRKDNLARHMKNIHSESKPFQCPEDNCGYSAKQKSDLTGHMKVHSQDKNEVCPHPNCGFKTKWTSYLKIHVKTHSTGEKRFKCHFCDFSCHQHGSLVCHVRRHTGETPFSGQLCPYTSKKKDSVILHMKTH